MKKIGILYGQERNFPMALIEKINSKGIENVIAEPVRIDKVIQGEKSGYAVIIDRISQDVPFYRTYLKNAALTGTAVINNPFWWSADEKFFNNCLMTKMGIPVPKTALLPSFHLPVNTTHESFFNLTYPLDWEGIFNYVGFPAYMKPFTGGNWNAVYHINNKDEFFYRHSETGQTVMMLQEEIVFEEYYRCYCIGSKYVHIMPYDPRNPFDLRYQADFTPSQEKLKQMEEIVLRINKYLGYDFNSVELAVKDGVPYAIDFCNPAPDADVNNIGEENFEWVVDNVANYAIERAQMQNDDSDNLTWGTFVQRSTQAETAAAPAKPRAKKETAPKEKPAPKIKTVKIKQAKSEEDQPPKPARKRTKKEE